MKLFGSSTGAPVRRGAGSTIEWQPCREGEKPSAAARRARQALVIGLCVGVDGAIGFGVSGLYDDRESMHSYLPQVVVPVVVFIVYLALVLVGRAGLVRDTFPPIDLFRAWYFADGRAHFEIRRSAIWEDRWNLLAMLHVAHAGEGVVEGGPAFSFRMVRRARWLWTTDDRAVLDLEVPSSGVLAVITCTGIQVFPSRVIPATPGVLGQIQGLLQRKGGGRVLVLPDRIQVVFHDASSPVDPGGPGFDVGEACRLALRLPAALESLEGTLGFRDAAQTATPKDVGFLRDLAEPPLRLPGGQGGDGGVGNGGGTGAEGLVAERQAW